MPDIVTPVIEPSLINQQPAKPPVEPTPESKLFPEPTPPKPDEPKPAEPTPEPKKEEPKPDAPKPSPDAIAPVDYENLKLPEGSLLSAEELAAVKKDAKDNKLSLDQAQGILSVKNDAVKSFQARQADSIVKARQEWKASWTKDPEYGGDKLAESTELAKRAWDRLADNELKTLADQTGFGDHPAVLRMMARAGRLFSEDQMIRGNIGAVPKPKSPEEVLYGGTTPGPEVPMS